MMSEIAIQPGSQGVSSGGDPTRDIRLGSTIAFMFFVIFLGWAALAPLDAGIYAQGSVAVAGNRQSVQHREGGVIRAINVREGDHVRAGEILIEMAAPDLVATERALTSEYLNLVAQRARLSAERGGRTTIAPPAEFIGLSESDRALASEALGLQRSQLRARRGSSSAQQSVLGQRSRQLGEQRSGFANQAASFREQRRILEDELRGLRELEKKGFASTNRIRALERAQEELRGREAAMLAEMARTSEGMGETRMQALSLDQTTLEQISTELRDTQARILEVHPRLVAAREQLQRTRVRAPVSGAVVGLSVFTVGGVAAPGQTLMDIVPDNKRLLVQARVEAPDADDVFEGQTAQVRFVSVHDRTLPLLEGRVKTISADSFSDERTGQAYFRAEVEVSPTELKKVRATLGRGALRPGLPVEVVLAVRKRTALQYILEPFTVHFWRALREQ